MLWYKQQSLGTCVLRSHAKEEYPITQEKYNKRGNARLGERTVIIAGKKFVSFKR